jgi:hypothetical protein
VGKGNDCAISPPQAEGIKLSTIKFAEETDLFSQGQINQLSMTGTSIHHH